LYQIKNYDVTNFHITYLIQKVVKSGLLVQKSKGHINTETDFDLNGLLLLLMERISAKNIRHQIELFSFGSREGPVADSG